MKVKGKRTKLMAILGALFGGAGIATGQLDPTEGSQLIWAAITFFFLRDGVGK